MKLKLIISDFLNTPLKTIPKKLMSQFSYRKLARSLYNRDINKQSFTHLHDVEWTSIVSVDDLFDSGKDMESAAAPAALLCKHQFEILGSGWVDWNYYPQQTENNNFDKEGEWLRLIVDDVNLEYSKKVWSEILKINPDYHPIDWQLERKSGIRYNGLLHFSKLKSNIIREGLDVKVVWELGRLQHLPLMLSAAIHDNGKTYLDEIKCQILDFIMSNPPRWGVQWTSAMDVSMRLFSMSVSMDLLLQLDNSLKQSQFQSILTASILDHIEHAWAFREHKDGLANNHYLANLVGLLYGTYALQKESALSITMEKAAKELILEIDKQFLPDGGNFESSIPYHYFGMEISILGLSIVKRLRQKGHLKFISDRHLEKLDVKMRSGLEMMKWTEIADGLIPQIGDNDSARMINMTYSSDNAAANERNYLDYSGTLHLVNGYFNKSENALHARFIQSILNNELSTAVCEDSNVSVIDKDETLPFSETTIYDKGVGTSNLLEELTSRAFTDFGLYVFKGKNIYLCINGTNRHVQQYWPHTHNDKLSFELWINGKAIVQDPGTYIYTANAELRNKYRSINAHATAIFGKKEQNEWEEGLDGVFRTIPKTKVTLLSVSENAIKLKLKYGDIVHIREFKIEKDKIIVNDWGNGAFKVNKYPGIPFSPGYGKVLSTV